MYKILFRSVPNVRTSFGAFDIKNHEKYCDPDPDKFKTPERQTGVPEQYERLGRT